MLHFLEGADAIGVPLATGATLFVATAGAYALKMPVFTLTPPAADAV
jgi:hypothetical protein